MFHVLHKPHITKQEATQITTAVIVVLVGFEVFCLVGFWSHRQMLEAASIVTAWCKEGIKKVVAAFISEE